MIILFTLEDGYILIPSARGQRSHFNNSTPRMTYVRLYGLDRYGYSSLDGLQWNSIFSTGFSDVTGCLQMEYPVGFAAVRYLFDGRADNGFPTTTQVVPLLVYYLLTSVSVGNKSSRCVVAMRNLTGVTGPPAW